MIAPPAVLILAFAFDQLLGEPAARLHPVVWIGRLIEWLDDALQRCGGVGRAAGALLVVVVLLVAGGVAWAASRLIAALPVLLDVAVTGLAAGILLARRSLSEAARAVQIELDRGDLPAARAAVANIVGRDAGDLDGEGVAAAAIESVAENTVDGVVAPLLYLAVGGLPGIVLYKAVNTMDSMLGYLGGRYRRFGWAAARLDDFVNWPAARISAPIWCVAAWLCRFDVHRSWSAMRRDGLNHPSPNAGISEAAAAGALGVQLGGTSWQDGRRRRRPRLGEPRRRVTAPRICEAIRLSEMVSIVALLALAGFNYILR